MVLESLLDVRFVRKNPLFMFFLAVIVSSVGMWVAYFTFPESAAILSIANIAIAIVPIMHRLFVIEEETECLRPGFAIGFLARHSCTLKMYAWFFIGLIVSCSFWYVVMPLDVKASVFREQDHEIDKITQLKNTMTGAANAGAANAETTVANMTSCSGNYWCWFGLIVYNNASVLLWAILFSFIYGAGAIFLISWNASIIGVVIGRDILGLVAQYQTVGPGLQLAAAYAHGLFNALGFLPHGLPEAMGYFIGAIAGAIISVAISKQKYKTHEFEIIAKDAFFLMLLALGCIIAGALIEAYLLIGG